MPALVFLLLTCFKLVFKAGTSNPSTICVCSKMHCCHFCNEGSRCHDLAPSSPCWPILQPVLPTPPLTRPLRALSEHPPDSHRYGSPRSWAACWLLCLFPHVPIALLAGLSCKSTHLRACGQESRQGLWAVGLAGAETPPLACRVGLSCSYLRSSASLAPLLEAMRVLCATQEALWLSRVAVHV